MFIFECNRDKEICIFRINIDAYSKTWVILRQTAFRVFQKPVDSSRVVLCETLPSHLINEERKSTFQAEPKSTVVYCMTNVRNVLDHRY